MITAFGCEPQRATPESKNLTDAKRSTHPILYQRTGGIAGTDDRVVIWTDGFVEVTGKILADTAARVPEDRLHRLHAMFAGWEQLNDRYLASNIADAYTIKIHYGGKSVTASDLARDLPEQFRRVFAEIESIAAAAQTTDEAPAPKPNP